MSSTEQTPPQEADAAAQNNQGRRGRGGRGRGGRGNRGRGRKPATPSEPAAASGAAAAAPDGPMEVRKVAGSSDVRAVAGAIAHNVRDGSAPTLMVMGPRSVNQAVKAIAVARTYLVEDGHELQCQPEFVHVEMEDKKEKRSGLRLVLKREDVGGDDGSTTLLGDELKVASSSVPTTLAGAIAKRIRSDDSVAIVAIGANSVNQALKGIAIARKYLVDDGKDVQFRPGFVHVTLENDDRTAVKFQLFSV